MKREGLLGTGVFVAASAVLLARFLIPRPIAMSNNGDGFRVLCGAGINWDGGPEAFIHLTYPASPGEPCKPTYLLSQSWLAWFARLLGDGTLSLVMLGVLSSVIAAAAIALLVLGLPYGLRTRLVVAAALLLVVGDSAFFGYFASILGEGTAFLGLLLMAGGLLLIARPGRWSYAGMAVTLAGGVLGVNAKVQTLTILPLLALAVLLVRPGGRRRWLPGLLVIGALTAVTLYAQQSVEPAKEPDGTLAQRPGDDSREINMFNSIFRNIVDGEHDTQADLAELGLPASFAQYAGNGWWGAHPATMDPLYPRYRAQISRHNVVAYFTHHPGRAIEVFDQAAGDLLTARPDYLGSFDASAGFAPHEQEYRMPVVSWLTGLLAPLGLFVLIPAWLLIAVRALWQRRTPLGVVLAFLLAVAGSQFVAAAIGDGIEGIKHQAVALFATLLALLLAGLPQFRGSESSSRTGSGLRRQGVQDGGNISSANTSSPADSTTKSIPVERGTMR